MQLDRLADTRLDRFRHIERLGDKIKRAHLQALYLRRLLGCQHDDRNVGDLLIFARLLHHIESCFFRHIQVKKHKREKRSVFTH